MKFIIIYIVPLFLFFSIYNNASTTVRKNSSNLCCYFPVNKNITLVYESSLGECLTRYSQDSDFTICSTVADKFRYSQNLIVKDDGVYVKDVYQRLKVFLFIKKEGSFTYGKPLLHFPLPLTPGLKWEWEGDELSDGVTSKVKITGKALDKESVLTKAGKFDAIKIESVIEGSSNSRNKVTEWYAEGIGLIKASIKIEGGGFMGILRDILGYGTIDFELKELRKTVD
jgi:hypothetical protein